MYTSVLVEFEKAPNGTIFRLVLSNLRFWLSWIMFVWNIIYSKIHWDNTATWRLLRYRICPSRVDLHWNIREAWFSGVCLNGEKTLSFSYYQSSMYTPIFMYKLSKSNLKECRKGSSIQLLAIAANFLWTTGTSQAVEMTINACNLAKAEIGPSTTTEFDRETTEKSKKAKSAWRKRADTFYFGNLRLFPETCSFEVKYWQ